jgi:hypothetical protein
MNSKIMDNNITKSNRGLKLPLIIGTKDFLQNEYIGLVNEDEEEEEDFNNEIKNDVNGGIPNPPEGGMGEIILDNNKNENNNENNNNNIIDNNNNIIDNNNNNNMIDNHNNNNDFNNNNNNKPEDFYNKIQQSIGRPPQSQNMFAEEENKENENKNDEEAMLKDEKKTKNVESKEFTWIQIIALFFFICGFIIMIVGVVALNWWFSEMTSVFLVVGIILMICLRKEEAKAVSVFMKGVGDFASISLAVGLARGINLTLENGMISDTILNGLAGSLGQMNKVLFAIVMIFIYIILGIFIQSSSGLAVLSMPIFAPLAEQVNCSRALIVNAYMFGQNLVGFVTPTGLLLIILQITGVSYYQWLKFIWPYMIVIFIYILILIMINTAL